MARAKPRKTKAPDEKDIDELISEALVDSYGEAEERMSMAIAVAEGVECPFETEVLGLPVTVERLAESDDGSVVAVCRNKAGKQNIPLLDLPLPAPPPRGVEWIEAYRRFHGVG
ncbi:MAG: hypothetical protein AB2A00_14520 [Myxococcota bacterium]